MKDFLQKLIKFISIPWWVVLLLSVFSGVSLVLIFTNGLDTQFYSYIVYLVSAYALSALCYYCYKYLPDVLKSLKQKLASVRYINRFVTDDVYKKTTMLNVSLVINIVYILINAVSAIIYQTAWFAIFAAYYTIMALMRFLILRYVHSAHFGENRVAELKRSRLCSVILFCVNLALSAAVLMMLYQNRGYDQHGVLIYIIALYTFYSTITAVVDIVKTGDFTSPLLSTASMVKLAEALVSMLLLETSMLAQFGADTTYEFKWLMIALTGGGVALAVTVMASYIFIKSTTELKKNK